MSRETVSIKGTKKGLVIFLDSNREFEELKRTLHRKMESARGFFNGARFSFSDEQLRISSHQKDELENICRQYGLIPVPNEPQHFLKKDYPRTSRKVSSVPSQSDAGEAALLVRRSLRSGQCVSHSGHIVVIGDVHPGAEVVSGGSIIVMGSCRGHVHAGCGGNRSAKIIAIRLAPTVLSISERRLPPEQIDKIPTGCTVARLSGQEIVFEKYISIR